MGGERDLARLLATMAPEVREGEFVFVTVAAPAGLPVHATVVEDEGTTVVMARQDADVRGLEYDFVAGWITLRAHSALDAVGLTAAVSTALAEDGISCNVLAGRFHDHLLVPIDRVDDAVSALIRAAAQE